MDEEFLTPESSGYHPDYSLRNSTPGTQRSSLSFATSGDDGPSLNASSGKKRPADSDATYEDDGSAADTNNTSFIGRMFANLTPWKKTPGSNKRARSSLDSMSGSAIKSANRHYSSGSSEEGNSSRSHGNSIVGGGAKTATLGKLNLEHKFAPSPAIPTAATNYAAMTMPVQTLNGQLTASDTLLEENNDAAAVAAASAAAKRVSFATTTEDGSSAAAAGTTIKSVRVGATTFVSSNTTTATNKHSNTVTFHNATSSTTTLPFHNATVAEATTPKFNIGTSSMTTKTATPNSSTKLKDVRLRMATPAVAREGRGGGTPARRGSGVRYFGNNNSYFTLPQDGVGVAINNINNDNDIINDNNKWVGGYQRRSINLSTTSRGGGAYKRRAINARGYKPMNTLLSRIHHAPSFGAAQSPSLSSKQQSLFLSNSIADQILRDTQNKLFQSTIGSGSNQMMQQETSLFGRSSDNFGYSGARTFAEEEGAQYKAVNKTGTVVPRVRMNRLYGTGQTGWRAPLQVAPSASTTTTATAALETASQSVAIGAAITSTAGTGATPSVSLQPSIAGKGMYPTTSLSTRNQFTAEIPEKSKSVTFIPYTTTPISIRGEGKTQLTPCKADDNLSQQQGEELCRLVETDAFKRKAMQNNPFEDVSEATKPPKRKKVAGTPHPKKATRGSSVTTTTTTTATTPNPVSEAAGGTPFQFMPGGGAASSKVSTPLAFSYDKKKSDVPQSSTPSQSQAPVNTTVDPPATTADTSSTSLTTPLAAQGWGDIFKSQRDRWKCSVCTTLNPKDKTVCMSCDAPKDGGTISLPAAETMGEKNGDGKKAASIGSGGFTFGAPASDAAPAPAVSSAGSISAGGFSFVSNSASTSASTPAPAIKFGATPSKIERKEDDTKASNGVGFSFTATPAKAKAPSSGFIFGAVSSSKAESDVGVSDEKKDDSSKGSAGFSFASASSSSSTMKESFQLGQNSASSGADERKGDTVNTGPFQFGATPGTSKPKRRNNDEEEEGNQDGGKKASVGSGFIFGAPAAENKSTPSTAPFVFGAATSKKVEVPSASAAFAFGGMSEKKADNSAAPFSFGTTPTTLEKKDGTAPTSTPFSFGPTATSAISTPAEKKEDKPEFMFGQSTPSTTPAPEKKDNSSSTPASSFAFGQASATTAKTPAPSTPFQFGSHVPTVSSAATSSFGGSSFGLQQPAAAPQPAASVPAFAFGAAAPTPAPTNATPAFTFGGSAQPATTSGFSFGSNSTGAPASSSAFSFGSNTVTPAFGMPPGMTSASTPAPFGGGGFGGAQTPAMNGAATGGFNIGTGGEKKTPGRRIIKARRPAGGGR